MNIRWLVATLNDAGYARLFGAGKTPSHGEHDTQWLLLTFHVDEVTSPRDLFDRTVRGDSSFMRGVLRTVPDDDFVDQCLGAMDNVTRHHDS